MLNQWILFEQDKCDKCHHPKVCKLSLDPDEQGNRLQVIISCDCDLTVFDEAWKGARDSGELMIVVGDYTVMDMVEDIAKRLK